MEPSAEESKKDHFRSLDRFPCFTSDLSTVFVDEACVEGSMTTIFVFALLEPLIACVLLKEKFLPWLFAKRLGPEKKARWENFEPLKKQTMVGFVVKILVRLSCAVQIGLFVLPHLELDRGLFADFRPSEAIRRLRGGRQGNLWWEHTSCFSTHTSTAS